MSVYLAGDALLVVSCVILHITMMWRFHSRRDLRFRATLLSLAAFFLVCGGAFALDVYRVWSGSTVGGGWPQLLAGIVCLCAALVVARPEGQRYYMAIGSPEKLKHHQDEIARLVTRIAERERNAGDTS